MILQDYVNKLKATKTYKAGLLTIHEYGYQSKLFGLIRNPDHVPDSKKDGPFVFLDFSKNRPTLPTFYTDRNNGREAPSLDTTHANKVLFIFIKMTPVSIVVSSPQGGYELKDGHSINADLKVRFQVNDIENFWNSSDDPLELLEDMINNKVKDYFLGKWSSDILSNKADTKKYIENSIGTMKSDLEKIISNKPEEGDKNNEEESYEGITVNNALAEIENSEELKDVLQRIHRGIYDEGGQVDRKATLRLMDEHTEFSPYNLRDVCQALAPSLLNNFYNMSFNDALSKVRNELEKRSKEYAKNQYNFKIIEIEKRLEKAKNAGLDSKYIGPLEEKFAEALMELPDDDHTSKEIQYLATLQLPTSNETANQITDNNSQK